MLDRIPDYIPPCPEPQMLHYLQEVWGLSLELACRFLAFRQWLHRMGPPMTVLIISGRRTAEDQAELKRRGRPAADPHLSTHVPRPGEVGSTGLDIDIWPDHDSAWVWVSLAAEATGLRHGGGSAIDESGLPSDKNHLDLGPKWAS